jgi:hypothetical protein
MRLAILLFLLVGGAGLYAQAGEIDIEYGGNSVPSGGQVDIGTVDLLEAFDLQFTIRNLGTGTLNILGPVTVTDTDNCVANVFNQPAQTAIPPNDEANFNVRVTNDGSGNFSADLNIPSDDTDEGAYTIQIVGVAVVDDTDDDDDDDEDCSTGTGSGSALILAGLGATAALLYRNRRRTA